MSQITIYRDNAANAIFFESATGVQFLNSLQATAEDENCSIHDLSKGIEIVSNTAYTQFVDENGAAHGNTSVETCDALNALFRVSGNASGDAPVITSPLAVSLTTGETLNYELTATFGVGYEWDLSNVPGITTVEGNVRKLVGGSSLTAGSYNIPVKAINYYGVDSETIVLTVSRPEFRNTKSVQFKQNDWLGGDAALIPSLERAANGSGASDSWSISGYFKAGSSNNQSQTILYYGSNDVSNGNHIHLYWNGNNSVRQQLVLKYGSNNNYLEFKTAVGTVSNNGSWRHFLITYTGDPTGVSSGAINDYYTAFSIYIDGVLQNTVKSNSNYGTSDALVGQNFRIGRYNTSSYMRNNCKVDELAVFDSDQSANVANIYNSGNPFDLLTLGTPPVHWWRMGDGDEYPDIQDVGTESNCTLVMYNMTVADIVNDVP